MNLLDGCCGSSPWWYLYFYLGMSEKVLINFSYLLPLYQEFKWLQKWRWAWILTLQIIIHLLIGQKSDLFPKLFKYIGQIKKKTLRYAVFVELDFVQSLKWHGRTRNCILTNNLTNIYIMYLLYIIYTLFRIVLRFMLIIESCFFVMALCATLIISFSPLSFVLTFWLIWSYASHGAQCDVTTGHSTCGYFVRDYRISFRLFALSNPSVSTLCLKDPRIGGWQNSAGSSSDGQVILVATLSSNSKNRENSLFNNNKKSFLLKHVCETINNNQTMFVFLANRRRKNIKRGRVTMRCG